MANQNENRICQNCKQNFIIEPEDFSFYEKIKVPPPTFCPECRMIRRMCWRNERSLFKRKCDKMGEEIITMFHPNAPVKVYERNVWWSDVWNPLSYGQDYDFSRPFFEQFRELLSRVPLASLGNTNVINSPYVNHTADARNCYLLFGSYKAENVFYSNGVVETKDSLDLYKSVKCENCYNDSICAGNYKTHFAFNTDESINSFFLRDCVNLQDCIGCVNLRSKKHCILNEQYTKEEYLERKKGLDFGSYKILSSFEKKFNAFTMTFPRKYGNNIKIVNSTGDNMLNVKNTQYSFDVYNNVEDSKFAIHTIDLKNGYDGYGFGAGSHLMYEGVDSGLQSANQYFAVLAHNNFKTQYVYMCYGSNNLFGCIGIRKGGYCILNKKYSQEEYEKLLPKIIEHMTEVPYIDKNGQIYKYGEFFPPELSPFAYNETITQEYFPKTKTDIIEDGYLHRPHPERKREKINIKSEDLPDHIKNVPDSIIDKVIACPNGGNELTQCTEAYKIVPYELQFLRNNNIALPRYCPNCRHYQRLKQRNPLKLWHRSCMCDKTTHHTHLSIRCPNEFETSYAPERPEIIYCEKCYQQEVY